MTRDRNDSFSDTDLGGALSRQLWVGEPPAGAVSISLPERELPRFTFVRPGAGQASSKGNPTVTPSRPPAPSPVPAVEPPPPDFMGDWQAMVQWCLDCVAAEAVFVLDLSGLLVASSGAQSAAELEGIGARMLFALQQGDGLGDTATRAVEFELGDKWFLAFRLTTAGQVTFLLGFASKQPVNALGRQRVLRAFEWFGATV